jgi:hypothetical protein
MEMVVTEYKRLARTDYLFARPSFASGFARALDLFGGFNRYNTSRSAKESDERAIANDWAVVGRDLQEAFDRAGCK